MQESGGGGGGQCTSLPSGSLGSSPWLCRLPPAALSPGPVSDAQSPPHSPCPTPPSRPWTGPCPPPGPPRGCPTAAEITAAESERQEGDCAPGGLCPVPGPSRASGVWSGVGPRKGAVPPTERRGQGSWGPDAGPDGLLGCVSGIHTRRSVVPSPACHSAQRRLDHMAPPRPSRLPSALDSPLTRTSSLGR